MFLFLRQRAPGRAGALCSWKKICAFHDEAAASITDLQEWAPSGSAPAAAQRPSRRAPRDREVDRTPHGGPCLTNLLNHHRRLSDTLLRMSVAHGLAARSLLEPAALRAPG